MLDRLGQTAHPQRDARSGARRGLERGQAPSLRRRGGDEHPRASQQLDLALVIDEAVQAHAVLEPARGDLRLEDGTMLTRSHDVEDRAGGTLHDVQEHFDALVALEPAQVDQRRLRRARARAVLVGLGPVVVDLDGLAWDAERHELPCGRLGDGDEAPSAVEPPQGRGLGHEGRELPNRPISSMYCSRWTWWTYCTCGTRSQSGVRKVMPLTISSATSASRRRAKRRATVCGKTLLRPPGGRPSPARCARPGRRPDRSRR